MDETCTAEGCQRKRLGRRYCGSHQRHLRKYGEVRPLRPIRKPGEHVSCSFEGCERLSWAKGLCQPHYTQQWRGEALHPITRAAPRALGDRYITNEGYVRIWRDHPNAYKGRVLEHVFVMSEMLGRPLLPGETVHHKNGVRHDNRPSNLELWVTFQPAGQRACDLVEYAHEILRRYGAST